MEVLTTVTLVLGALREKIKEIHPDVTLVYDPSLSYETGVASGRINTNYDVGSGDRNKPTALPLFLNNRSPLRPTETSLGRGSRTTYEEDELREKLSLTSFKSSHCEFDFRFMYIDKGIQRIENFEIQYVNKTGISGITEFDVDLTFADIGTWKYYISWNPLGDLTTSKAGNNYLSLDGSARVYGWFLGITG